jgi:3D (Asp-Asp-Asp) domain-containing protein
MRSVLTVMLLVGASFSIPAQGAMPSSTRRARHRVMRMEATAFTPASGATAAGTVPHQGIVAADPAVLPLGSRIRVTGANSYNGIYTVTDTGNKVRGRHIDLCLGSAAEARQFGKKIVRVQLLRRGAGKQDARERDIAAR